MMYRLLSLGESIKHSSSFTVEAMYHKFLYVICAQCTDTINFLTEN